MSRVCLGSFPFISVPGAGIGQPSEKEGVKGSSFQLHCSRNLVEAKLTALYVDRDGSYG